MAAAMPGAADVPLIRADERPTKVKPEKPGGMESPGSGQADLHAEARGRGAPAAAAREADAAARAATPGPTAATRSLAAAGRSASPASVTPETHQAAVHSRPAAAAARGKPPGKAPQAQLRPPLQSRHAAKAGGPRLQLASVRSEEAARQEWDRIKRDECRICSASLSATPDPRRSRRQGDLLPHPDWPVADRGCRRADLRRAEAAQYRVHHCPISAPRSRAVILGCAGERLNACGTRFLRRCRSGRLHPVPAQLQLARSGARAGRRAARRDRARRRAGPDRPGGRPGGAAAAAALAPLPVGRAPRHRCRTRRRRWRPGSARG